MFSGSLLSEWFHKRVNNWDHKATLGMGATGQIIASIPSIGTINQFLSAVAMVLGITMSLLKLADTIREKRKSR